MNKEEARETMRKLRKNLGQAERQIRQAEAMERLLSLPELRGAEWVYPFVSCGTEIDTIKIIRHLLAEGQKRIAVPRVLGEQMEFVVIHSLEELRPGTRSILEPAEGMSVEIRSGVMLMPGLAFDRSGNRVGYGAGYYDRYLEEHDSGNLYKLAYAFDFQVVDAIEAEEHDRKVDAIVTERKYYRLQ